MTDHPNGSIDTIHIPIDDIDISGRTLADPGRIDDLMESISTIGLINAITVDTGYRLIAGMHRLTACRELGFDTIRANVVDLDVVDAELAEIDENIIRREFTRLERAELLQRRKEIYEAKYANGKEAGIQASIDVPTFYEDAATRLGVQPRTVELDVQIAQKIAAPVRDMIRDAPIANHKGKLLALARIEDEDEQARVAASLISEEASEQRQAQARLAPLMSSASPEWYTPREILDKVVEVMGGIDLDPCSNSHENPNVPATYHYTADDDGLSKTWHGRVYMNPPYGREIKLWVSKLVGEVKAGRVTQAIALVPARTDTHWFRQFRHYPRCFVFGRLKFSAYENSAPFPSAIVALNCDEEAFVEAFSKMGDIFTLVG